MRGGRVRLRIDTSRLTFLVVAPAEPLRQDEEGKPREAGAPRTDVNGAGRWGVQRVALRDGGAAGGRTAQPWEMGDRSGMAFRCVAIGSAAARSARAGVKAAA